MSKNPGEEKSRCRLVGRFAGGLLLPALCVVALVLTSMPHGTGGQAVAACDPQFTQVNEDGFGDRFNVYATAMKEFGAHLYIGTSHIAGANPEFDGSAELWRYDGANWEQITDDGFGNPRNTGIRNLAIFDGMLYAAVANAVDGAEIWRSTDGISWEPVMQGGFGVPGNEVIRALKVFRGRLYAGTQNTADRAGQLWMSVNGTTWFPIAPEGFGFPNNSSMHTMGRFGGMLYVGVRNAASGAQVWRSADGLRFEQVVGRLASTPDGFGNPNTVLVFHMHRFNDMLYLGTANLDDGFAIYRTTDGLSYEQVGELGFGDPDNMYGWRFRTFEKALWLGGANKNVLAKGASVWRTFDGDNWEEMVGPNGTYMGYGFDDTRNWGVRTFETFGDKLYIGTAQCPMNDCDKIVSGAEVWEWPGEVCPEP